MFNKKYRGWGLFNLRFALIASLLAILLTTGLYKNYINAEGAVGLPSTYNLTTNNDGAVDKDPSEIFEIAWVNAGTAKITFKTAPSVSYSLSPIDAHDGAKGVIAQRTNDGKPSYKIDGWPSDCNNVIRFESSTSSSDDKNLDDSYLDRATADIDFLTPDGSRCKDSREGLVTVTNKEYSTAYFGWVDSSRIQPLVDLTVRQSSDDNASAIKTIPSLFIQDTNNADLFRSEQDGDCDDLIIVDRTTSPISMRYYLLVGNGSLNDGNGYGEQGPASGYGIADLNLPNCKVVDVREDVDTGGWSSRNYYYRVPPKSNAKYTLGSPENASIAAGSGQVEQIAGDNAEQADSPSCTGSIDNGFGWIICPALEGIDGFINGAEAVISSKLAVNSSTFTGDSGDSLRRTWLLMARFASGLLSIIALIMIVSTALGFDFVSAYTIKKVLPRIVIGAIGMWLSWPLVVAYINFMNDLGRGIASLMYSAFPDAQNLGLRDIVAVVAESSGVVTDIGSGLIFSGLIVAGGAAAATAGLVGILAGALTVATAILVGVFSLAVREILIIMSVIFAPIAIASWILPNTNKLWKFWSSNLNKLLFMFPMIMALFAGAKIMAKISAEAINANPGSGFLEMLFPLIIFVSPLFFLPKLFKSAGGILTGVTAAAGKFGNKATGGWQNTLKSAGAERTKRRDYQKAVNQRNRQNNGVSVFGRPLPGSAASARAMNRLRTGQAVVPMTRGARLDARQAASRTAQATIIDRQKQLEEVIGNDVEAKKAIASGVSYEQLERTNRDLAARMKASGSAIHLGNRDAQAAATLSLASSGFATEEHIRKMAESFVDDKQTASALVSSATRAMKDKGNQTVGALKYNYGDGKIGYERVAEAKDASGNVVYETDASGNVVYETDASGNVVYETDASGNVVYETDAAGNAVIDSQGNPVPKRKAKTEKVIHTETGSLDESGQPTDQTYIETRRLAIRNALGSMSAVDLASLAIEGDGSGFKDKGINEALRNDTALATRILNDESAKLTAGQRQVLINLGAVPETKEPQEVRIVP